MVDIFDVLADPTRRALLRALQGENGSGAGRELTVSALVTELGASQPTVSKHLKVLRENGLVAVREEGQRRHYRLEAEPLGELAEFVAGFRAADAPPAPAPAPSSRPAPDVARQSTEFVGDRMGWIAATTTHFTTHYSVATARIAGGVMRGILPPAPRATSSASA